MTDISDKCIWNKNLFDKTTRGHYSPTKLQAMNPMFSSCYGTCKGYDTNCPSYSKKDASQIIIEEQAA